MNAHVNSMPAISLWQPWASLLVTRQPCEMYSGVWCHDKTHPHRNGAKSDRPMVKRFETRSWPCQPKYIGQRVAFHAAKRAMPKPVDEADTMIGEFRKEDGRTLSHPTLGVIDLPLGAVVGSGIITASLPIASSDVAVPEPVDSVVARCGERLAFWRAIYPPGEERVWEPTDISDQLPYGDWTPGRYAWLIEDAAPCTERCPLCLGDGDVDDDGKPSWLENPCPVCNRDGRCDPSPAVGHQGIWQWTP